MHIVDQILGETHFFSVAIELFKKSKPYVNLMLFKRLLKDIGIKFYDIQKNWIDSTSCPKIDCTWAYNKKNNSVDISLVQHSAIKMQLLWEQFIEQNKASLLDLCSSGKVLMKTIMELNFAD